MGPAEPRKATARRRAWPALALGALALAGVALVVREVSLAQRPPQGPVAVAWDREACAHCRMLVSEPRFAAQAHLRGGAVYHFDDPGCALLWAEEHAADLHELWFHDLASERWLRRGEVGFVAAEPTPMGYGLGARPLAEAAAMSPAQALALVRAREGQEEQP
jgi:hypothetical protein